MAIDYRQVDYNEWFSGNSMDELYAPDWGYDIYEKFGFKYESFYMYIPEICTKTKAEVMVTGYAVPELVEASHDIELGEFSPFSNANTYVCIPVGRIAQLNYLGVVSIKFKTTNDIIKYIQAIRSFVTDVPYVGTSYYDMNMVGQRANRSKVVPAMRELYAGLSNMFRGSIVDKTTNEHAGGLLAKSNRAGMTGGNRFAYNLTSMSN